MHLSLLYVVYNCFLKIFAPKMCSFLFETIAYSNDSYGEKRGKNRADFNCFDIFFCYLRKWLFAEFKYFLSSQTSLFRFLNDAKTNWNKLKPNFFWMFKWIGKISFMKNAFLSLYIHIDWNVELSFNWIFFFTKRIRMKYFISYLWIGIDIS